MLKVRNACAKLYFDETRKLYLMGLLTAFLFLLDVRRCYNYGKPGYSSFECRKSNKNEGYNISFINIEINYFFCIEFNRARKVSLRDNIIMILSMQHALSSFRNMRFICKFETAMKINLFL